MDTMSSMPASRAASTYGSRPTSPYVSNRDTLRSHSTYNSGGHYGYSRQQEQPMYGQQQQYSQQQQQQQYEPHYEYNKDAVHVVV